MSDKKKKILTPKEQPTTIKKTVILKSDREPPKSEPERQEKQQPPTLQQPQQLQPTIMLRTREQSAPKEEWNGTKLEIDMRDRRDVDTKSSSSECVMKEPVKFLDDNFEININAIEYMDEASTNYLVIGVIGAQGVGKSLILNLIAHGADSSYKDEILDGCNSTSTDDNENNEETNSESTQDNLPDQLEELTFTELSDEEIEADQTENIIKFKLQTNDDVTCGKNCTNGIDMYVTKDRIILLDCQPLWSAAILEMSPSPVGGVASARSSNTAMMGLQIASFLMSVCHVVVGVHDWDVDNGFIRFLHTAEMLRPVLTPWQPETPEPTQAEHNPHLVLVRNRCWVEDYSKQNLASLQELYRKAFQASKLNLKSGVYVHGDLNNNHKEEAEKEGAVNNAAPPINLCLLPELVPESSQPYAEMMRNKFDLMSQRLRQLIVGVTRSPISATGSLTEKAWFQYTAKAWETTRKCTFFMEYERLHS